MVNKKLFARIVIYSGILMIFNSCTSFINALNAPVYTYNEQLKEYFDKNDSDPIEGLYTITDKIDYDYPVYYVLSNDKIETKDNWAKIAIVKDSTSITRNYVAFVIEAEGYDEKFVFAEILKIKQAENLLTLKQHTTSGLKIGTSIFTFVLDEEKIFGTFEESDFSADLTIERTYQKYYPTK